MARRAALWVTPLVILLTVAAIVLRHRGSTEPSLPRPDRMATQDGWVQPFKNPVIPAGSLRAQGLWNDPDVLKDDGRYVMYLTSSVAEPFKPPIVPFRAVSLDGINWRLNPKEPVVMPAGTPFVSVETPSVVKFHGAYHMFFTGVYPESRQGVMAVGHAQSADGIHWTVTPRPVISPTLDPRDWNGFLVSEPGAIVRNDEIFVYFCALRARPGGRPPQDQSIGLAKTSDGVTFGPAVKVLSQSALYPPEKGFAGYSTPQPFELDGRVHLLYDVILYQAEAKPPWQQVALHHAVSLSDGQADFVQDERPLLTRNQLPNAMGEIDGPAALVDGDQVKMWFGGHAPVAALGPLIARGFRGDEFGIDFAMRPVADFRRDVAALTAR